VSPVPWIAITNRCAVDDPGSHASFVPVRLIRLTRLTRQSANPPIRQSASPPVRQSANPPSPLRMQLSLRLPRSPVAPTDSPSRPPPRSIIHRDRLPSPVIVTLFCSPCAPPPRPLVLAATCSWWVSPCRVFCKCLPASTPTRRPPTLGLTAVPASYMWRMR
jgi:hypothetical protein